jgi:hypothetical protein
MSEDVDVFDDPEANGGTESNSNPTVRAVLSKEGLSFEDPELISKTASVNISNSLISSLQKCPARAASDKWILSDLMPPDPLSPTTLGSAFHSVMEQFFTLPPDDRTVDGIRSSYKKVLNSPDYRVIAMDSDATIWLQKAINGYWNLHLEDPRMVHVPDRVSFDRVSRNGKSYVKSEDGLELFVDGKISPKINHKVLGFIDRLSIDDKTGRYVIDDWKTGKHASDYLPDKQKYPDFGYVRQQILYTMMMEESGYDIETARLIYPIADYEDPDTGIKNKGHVTVIDVKNTNYRRQAVEDVEQADSVLTQSVNLNRWECGPSPLCSWCPLVNICPAAMKIKKDNAVKSREEAPTGEFLKTGGIVRG